MRNSKSVYGLILVPVFALAVMLFPTSKRDLGIVRSVQASAHKECSNASLQGSFGYTATGTLLPAAVPPPFAGPFAEIGRQTFDGNGNTTATATINANGNVVPVTIQGTYTVNPDCTGSMTRNVSPIGAIAHDDLVIDDDGVELRTIATDPGSIETYVYRKQFPGKGQE